MKKIFNIDEIVGCWGEGYNLYKIIGSRFSDSTYYLEAWANTSIDGGWCNSKSIRKVANKTKIRHYAVKFEIENPE